MNVYLDLGLILAGYAVCWFLFSIILKRMDIADIAWGLGFILINWYIFFISGSSIKGLVVNILISIWGGRLAFHIYKRNHNKQEDARYAEWRKSWKHFYLRSFLQVFLLQSFLIYIISLPAIFINLNNSVVDIFLVSGVIVWIAGFYFETVGDKQLATFIKNPENKDKIMTSGLWRYTRHPNYFGEVVMWWGIFVCSLGIPNAIFTIIGPLTITYLILFVSGIPLLEKRYTGNTEYELYKKRTSAFIPLPPKSV